MSYWSSLDDVIKLLREKQFQISSVSEVTERWNLDQNVFQIIFFF